MTHQQVISNALLAELPTEGVSLTTFFEFYTKENGFGFQGYISDSHGNRVAGASYSSEFDIKINDSICSWNQKTIDTPERWNKAQFIVYKDGRSEFNSWWDEEFQKSLYSNS